MFEKSLFIKFSGSYDLLKWIIKDKYHIYNGRIYEFLQKNNYKICRDKQKHKGLYCPAPITNYGVSKRIWNLLNKDLIILDQGKAIDFHSLQNLKQEYERTK